MPSTSSTPDVSPSAGESADGGIAGAPAEPAEPVEPVEPDPVKLVRLAWMLVALLDETRIATLDVSARARLAGTVQRSLAELGSALPDVLVDELAVLIPLPRDRPPSQADLLILEAQLVGWLRGLLAPADG
jgi:hypothetical protein